MDCSLRWTAVTAKQGDYTGGFIYLCSQLAAAAPTRHPSPRSIVMGITRHGLQYGSEACSPACPILPPLNGCSQDCLARRLCCACCRRRRRCSAGCIHFQHPLFHRWLCNPLQQRDVAAAAARARGRAAWALAAAATATCWLLLRVAGELELDGVQQPCPDQVAAGWGQGGWVAA